MMKETTVLSVEPIGETFVDESGFGIEIREEYRRALQGLEGYSHLQVVWWFSGCDTEESRRKCVEEKPYTRGPEVVGTFATHSPERPNPIALSVVQVTYLDMERGVIGFAWMDAFPGSPVLDIKPYIPSMDRVESPRVPLWCEHWPRCVEESGNFDWEAEFNF